MKTFREQMLEEVQKDIFHDTLSVTDEIPSLYKIPNTIDIELKDFESLENYKKRYIELLNEYERVVSCGKWV